MAARWAAQGSAELPEWFLMVCRAVLRNVPAVRNRPPVLVPVILPVLPVHSRFLRPVPEGFEGYAPDIQRYSFRSNRHILLCVSRDGCKERTQHARLWLVCWNPAPAQAGLPCHIQRYSFRSNRHILLCVSRDGCKERTQHARLWLVCWNPAPAQAGLPCQGASQQTESLRRGAWGNGSYGYPLFVH